MKRVEVAPGEFVTISTTMVEKAARVFASGAFTPDQVRQMGAAEPKGARAGLLIGKPKGNLRTLVGSRLNQPR